MNSKEKKSVMTEEDIMNLLDSCYEKCINGIPKVSPSVEELANDYLKKHRTTEEACKAMLKNQIAKCTTSGVVTGFGGFITMPVAIPANVGSVIYVQMRMIACVAYMADCFLQALFGEKCKIFLENVASPNWRKLQSLGRQLSCQPQAIADHI